MNIIARFRDVFPHRDDSDLTARITLGTVIRLASTLAAVFILTACGSDPKQTPPQTPQPQPTPQPTPTPTGLGNLTAEVSYFQTMGQGTIQIVTDPNTPDPCCFMTVIANQRYILLNPNFFSYPPAVQTFFLAHEHGHHYLRHEQTPPQGFTQEYSADAYGIRVLAAVEGQASAQSVITALGASNSPGDATHPTAAQRAAYMSSVLSAMLANPAKVPAPPATPPPTQTGTIVIRNTTLEAGRVYINFSFMGVLLSGQADDVVLPPGSYRIDLQGAQSGQFYIPVFVTLAAGQTIFVP